MCVIFGMGQTRNNTCYHVTIALPIQFPLSPKLSKNTLWNGLRNLSNFQIIPIQIPIALYQARKNGVIAEEQYQTNNPTKPYIITLKVLSTSKGRQ